MSFKIFETASEYIDLPFPEKTYRVVSPPHEIGVFMQRLVAAQLKAARGGELTDDEQEMLKASADDVAGIQYERLLLGDLYDELKADKVNSVRWSLIVNAAALWAATNNVADVEEFWNSGGQRTPKAPKVPEDRLPKQT